MESPNYTDDRLPVARSGGNAGTRPRNASAALRIILATRDGTQQSRTEIAAGSRTVVGTARRLCSSSTP